MYDRRVVRGNTYAINTLPAVISGLSDSFFVINIHLKKYRLLSPIRLRFRGNKSNEEERWHVDEPKSRRDVTRPSLSKAANIYPFKQSSIWKS